MSNSVRPHRPQPTKLHPPWDSPGKNTGVGCHFLLQCMKVKSESEVSQSCPTRPHGPQSTRLLRPSDYPGQSTGEGCHCLLPHLSTQGVIGAMQAVAAAPPPVGTTGAPPPSKQPLVSNGQPATVNGPAQPLVGAQWAPPPLLSIKGAQILTEGMFFEKLVCHLFDLLAF